jgi:hypothetical protein
LPPRGITSTIAAPAVLSDLSQSGIVGGGVTRAATNSTPPAFCMSTSNDVADWQPIALPASAAPLHSVAGNAGGVVNTHYDSGIWAGYAVDGIWDGAQGEWTVEQAHPQSGTPNEEATWVGVGGDDADLASHGGKYGLIQLGSEMRTGQGYRSWFEYLCACSGGGSTAKFHNYAGVSFTTGDNDSYLRPGDVLWALTYWDDPTTACFVMTDQTRASGSFSGCVDNVPIPYDRNSMEFIDENQLADGYYLADFDHTHWLSQNSFNASKGTYSKFTNYRYVAYVMYDSTGPTLPPCQHGILAYPENASNGSSDTVFCNQS